MVKGSKWILGIVAFALCLSFAVFAQDQYEYALPLEKTIGPGHVVVEYDKIAYNFYSDDEFFIRMERIDDGHVKLYVKPQKISVQIYCELSVQWGPFEPVTLQVNSSDGNSFTLGTETGYAEK